MPEKRSSSSEAFVGEKIPVFWVHPTKESISLMNSISEFSDNKEVKSATTGFYTKGDVAHFQKIKWIKGGTGRKAENIRPGHISRLKRRRNKKDRDDEDDGKGNRRPSESRVLSLILKIIIIILLFLIVLSLRLWLLS